MRTKKIVLLALLTIATTCSVTAQEYTPIHNIDAETVELMETISKNTVYALDSTEIAVTMRIEPVASKEGALVMKWWHKSPQGTISNGFKSSTQYAYTCGNISWNYLDPGIVDTTTISLVNGDYTIDMECLKRVAKNTKAAGSFTIGYVPFEEDNPSSTLLTNASLQADSVSGEYSFYRINRTTPGTERLFKYVNSITEKTLCKVYGLGGMEEIITPETKITVTKYRRFVRDEALLNAYKKSTSKKKRPYVCLPYIAVDYTYSIDGNVSWTYTHSLHEDIEYPIRKVVIKVKNDQKITTIQNIQAQIYAFEKSIENHQWLVKANG